MKIIQIYYEQYQAPLMHGFQNSKNKYNHQKGLVFTIKTKTNIGLGEAVLLDGFSHNTFQEMMWAAESFIGVVGQNDEYTFNELLVIAAIHCSNVPSVHFAIDTALYDIQAQKKNISLSRLCNKNSSHYVKISQTLINKESSIYNDVIKLKIGVNQINDDVSLLNQISEKHPLIKIRLDANQKFSIEEFENLYQKISHLNIDFFEEPIKNPNIKKIEYFKNKYPCLKYAIDESLYQKTNYEDWIKKGLINTMVLRPSILGGFVEFFKIVQLHSKNLQLLIASSLENSIGNMAIIHLASTIEQNNKHGVNIYDFFNEFIKKPVYTNRHIELKDLIGLGFSK